MAAARWLLPVVCVALSVVFPAMAGDGTNAAATWLDQAADAQLDARRREYAARQILLLADDESASILIAALKGTDGCDSALRRQVAATLLGESAPPGAEAALLEAAFGTDFFLADAAGKALAVLYSTLPDNELYTLLTRGARDVSGTLSGASGGGDDWLALSLRQARYRGRFKALVMAGMARKYAADPKPLPEPLVWCVREGLLDIEPALRIASVESLRHITGGEAPERLAALLYTETDTKVLLAALAAMGALRPAQFGEAVERHAAHADPRVALEALAALAAMGYPGVLFPAAPGRRAVATFVNHPSTPVRRRAIEILTATKNPAAVEFLTAALFDRVWANRAAAARGLGELGFSSAVGALHPLLNDSRPEVREEVAVALARFGVVGVASRMVDEARGGGALPLPFRIAAVRALGRIGDPRAVPALTECFASDDPALVDAAKAALENIRPAAAQAVPAVPAGEEP